MVSEEVVVNTIKRMSDSGIENSVIISTLRDIGLSDEQIRYYLSKVKGNVPEEGEEGGDSQSTQELLHTTTHNKLEEHSEKLGTVQKDVSGLHEKIDSITKGPNSRQLLSEITLLSQRISNIEKQVSDLKAMNSASKSLLEKILETNRKIVEKL